MSKCCDCGWEFNRDCETCQKQSEEDTERQKQWPNNSNWTNYVDPERKSDYDPWTESYY